MAATYTYAVRYEAEALCRTPLRTGGTDGDPQSVLRTGDGTALYQGSSLAGALRGWLAAGNASLAERLFGSQRAAGHLMVSDGVFAPDTESRLRPRLRIDGATGSAARGGKFDVAQLDAGSRFRFSLTWLGAERCPEEIQAVEQMLTALDGGVIRLGAQKSSGFGRVALTVRKSTYDLTDPADRAAWLREDREGQPLKLPEISGAGRVAFTVSGRADSLLVKAGAPLTALDQQGKAFQYTPNLTEGGRPVVPGSSVKGAVRSRAAMIAELDALYTALKTGDTSGYLDEYRRRCVTIGREVQLLWQDTKEKVTALDVDEEFGLIVRRENGTVETVRTGEVSVRGLYGYVE